MTATYSLDFASHLVLDVSDESDRRTTVLADGREVVFDRERRLGIEALMRPSEIRSLRQRLERNPPPTIAVSLGGRDMGAFTGAKVSVRPSPLGALALYRMIQEWRPYVDEAVWQIVSDDYYERVHIDLRDFRLLDVY